MAKGASLTQIVIFPLTLVKFSCKTSGCEFFVFLRIFRCKQAISAHPPRFSWLPSRMSVDFYYSSHERSSESLTTWSSSSSGHRGLRGHYALVHRGAQEKDLACIAQSGRPFDHQSRLSNLNWHQYSGGDGRWRCEANDVLNSVTYGPHGASRLDVHRLVTFPLLGWIISCVWMNGLSSIFSW